MQRRTKYGIVLSLLLLSGLLIYGFFCRFSPRAAPLVRADIFVSPDNLTGSFDTNEALSDSLYLYKVLSVRGSITKILKRESGNYVITLGDATPGKSVVDCNLDTLYNHRFLSFKNGDSITVRGTCAGRLQNVILVQCIIEK
ncbi:MAG TPA: hypothetical protein VGN00_01325 [Puia sp.]|jgi:hypothetical protein